MADAQSSGAAPEIRVGVLGAGQLGRMLALAGIPLGMRFTFLSDVASRGAEQVGDVIVGDYHDRATLERFADRVDVLTYEFENVPVDAAEILAARRPLWPPVAALATAQDRAAEKAACTALGIPVAPHMLVDSRESLDEAVRTIGAPGILKTRRMGYDGKGQARIQSPTDTDAAWRALGGVPLIYEGLVRFDRELSVIAVRSVRGACRVYPVTENHHRDGILRRSIAPAFALAEDRREEAARYAEAVMASLGYVGVFALEMFETAEGLVVNEMAPRVHNSGHWTIEGAETSQFENHVRAVCGLPLGDCASAGYSAMLNIIGKHPAVERVLSVPDTHLHLYDKSERPGRKLGHITVRSRTPELLAARLETLASALAE